MAQVSYEKAKLSDSERLSILFQTTYIQTYAVDGITFEFSNFIRQRFSPEFIENMIKEDPDRLIVALKNGNPVGVAEVIYDSQCPVRGKAVAELGKLYILQNFFGLGIGLGFVQEAERLVANRGVKEVILEVYDQNARAIAFFERLGYSSIGSVDASMETNAYENLVMHKVL